MAIPHYYMDTSSVLDLEAYGLIKRLRKVKIVIVQEVFNEIRDRNLKRRLARIVTDRGPQKRAAFIPNLYSLDYGERAIITAIVCEQRRRKRRRIYVSNDGAYTYPTTAHIRIQRCRCVGICRYWTQPYL